MRPIMIAILFALFLAAPGSVASDDVFATAQYRYASILFGTVSRRISADLEKRNLSSEEEGELISAVANRLAQCNLEAVAIFGSDIQSRIFEALANGEDDAAISRIIPDAFPDNHDVQVRLVEYSEALGICVVLVNQEFGVNYF